MLEVGMFILQYAFYEVHSQLLGKRGVPSMMKVRAMSFTQVCGFKHMHTANNIAMFLLQFTFM